MKDYYQILGVSNEASQDDIKKAFRALAHKYHPDKKQGDEEKFKEINQAYQILSNPKKRQQYDYGAHGFAGDAEEAYQGFSGFGGGGFGGFSNVFDLSDILRSAFSQARGYSQQQQQQYTQQTISVPISPEQALKGGTVDISTSNGSIKINIQAPKLTWKQKRELKKLGLL